MTTKTLLKTTLAILMIVLVVGVPAAAGGQILYVDDDGPAGLNKIQAAIDEAGDGDVVIVAEGRYFENISFNGKNITLTSTEPNDPNVVAATIIDGNNNGSVVTFNSGEDANCILNGFTITNGYARSGGGIYCFGSSPKLTNCTFSSNSSGHAGGGMYSYKANPILTDCTFIENSTDFQGGGIEHNMSSTALTNCKFSRNSSGHNGGGIDNNHSSLILTNCTFSSNSSLHAGGGIENNHSSLILTNCTFSGNSSGHNGGGIENHHSSTTLTNCTFSGNSSLHGGGGILNISGNTTLTDCTFNENSTDFQGGGVENFMNTATLTNCMFSGNWSGHNGGGMENSNSITTLTNCTFSGNSSVHAGGGMENISGNTTLTNCTFNENSTDLQGGGMENFSSNTTLTDCTFNENSAVSKGGGMENLMSSLILTNCTFSANTAESGGGMYNYDSSSGLGNCTFIANSTDSKGGGMENLMSSLILTNCTFSANTAESGGGMYNYDSSLGLGNCTFIANSADFGAGIYIDYYNRRMSLKNCTFAGNLAEYNGGGIYNKKGGVTTLVNCILYGNMAENNMFESAQIYGQPIIVNYSCIQGWTGAFGGTGNIGADPCFVRPGYWQPPLPIPSLLKACEPNPPDGKIGVSLTPYLSWTPGYYAISHDVYFGTANPPPFIGNQYAASFVPGTMDYETIYYWRIDEISKWGMAAGDLWTFTTYPFPSPPPMLSASYMSDNGQYILTEPDYHLLPDSPCINAGDPNYVAQPDETDLDGNPRVMAGRIDMGAYESPIFVETRILPRTINLASEGNWITSYIWLPEGYDVAEIEPNSVLLNNEIQPEQFSIDHQQQLATAVFNRQDIQTILVVGDISMKITGRLTNGIVFEAMDTIKVINKAGKN